VFLLASERILPAKTTATQTLLNQKRQRIDEALRPCRGDYSWKDEPRAKDVLRTYVCDIYDCLKEAYSYKVNIWEWEKEIAEEAISVTLGCWKHYKLGTHHLLLVEPLRNTITQHVGHELRSGPVQKAFVAPMKPEDYGAFGVDIASASPLLKMAIAARPPHPPAFTSTDPTESTPATHPRKIFVDPILEEKGWSVLDWANEAEVAYHTAADYLAGKTTPYSSSRLKLAKALNVSIQRLPK